MRLWLAITGFLLFAAGVAVGAAVFRGIGPAPLAQGPMFAGFDDFSDFAQSEEILRELDLTDDQKRLIEELRETNKQQIRAVWGELSRLRRELGQGIVSALTPEQRERWQKVKEDIEVRQMEERARRDVGRMRRDLALPADLEAKVLAILLETEKKRIAAWKSCSSKDREEFREAWRKISRERDAALEPVLGAPLFEKYREWKERRRGGRGGKNGKPDHEKREHPPGPPPLEPPPGSSAAPVGAPAPATP